MQDVGVRFSGSAVGAVGAARETSLAIDKVKVSAAGSSAPLRGMENDLGRVERSATAGSGAFRGLGKSVIFAGGAFLGAVGFVEVIKSSIDVVLAAQTGIAKLDRAIVNAHASVKALTPILEAHEAAMRKLAFGDSETRDAEAKLVTAFGATKKAMDEVKVAADLSRASNIPLADATKQLILLQEGNARAAKQFGLSLPDLTKAQWEAKAAVDGLNIAQEKGKVLYDELLPRIKAQAAAFAATPAGELLEFQKQIEHLQESIGQGLLPVVNKYMTEVDDWLAKGKNQKKVTDDVRKVVEELAGVLHDAKDATEAVLKVADPVVKALGGWKTVIEGLVGTEAAGTGLLGAGGAAGGLLGRLRALTLAPFVVSVLFEIGNKGEVQNKQPPGSVKGPKGTFVDPTTGNYVTEFNGKTYDTGIKTPGFKVGGAGDSTVTPPGTSIPGKGVQIPSVISPTHQTSGLPGFPAVDIMATPGTKILAPENGMITRISGSEPTAPPPDGQGGPWGLSIYFVGTETGNTYFLTHLMKVAGLGGYKRGAVIGLIGDYPGSPADHVHVGIHAGASAEATYPSGLFKPSDYLGKPTGATKTPYGPSQTSGGGGGTTTPPKTKKVAWVGATQANITTALGSVAATLKGLPATLDPVEKNAKAQIEALEKQLVPHMTAADEATVKVELAKWGKVLKDEITKNADDAKAATKKKAAEVKQGLAEATALGNWATEIGDFKTNLIGQFDQTLGVPQTYATPKALAAAEAGAEAINKRIAAGFYKNATTLKAATDQRDLLLGIIEDGLNGLEAAVTAAKTPYESAWSKLASAGDTAFSTQTQKTLTAMQTATTQALAGFVVAQTAAEKALADFEAGKTTTQTPEEAALAAFDAAAATTSEAKQRADIASQIADTQAQLDALTGTSDTTSGGGDLIDISTGITTTLADNTVAGTDIVAQRKTLLDQLASLQDQSDALDQQDQRAALQAAADASRTAADAAQTALEASLQAAADASRVAQDAQTSAQQAAYQAQADAAQTAYTDQRTLLQAAMDDQAGIIEASFEAGTITAATAFDELKKLYGDNGIDLANLSIDIAGVIYTGVAAWTDPIMKLMTDLQAAIAATQAALGLPVTSAAAATTSVAGSVVAGGALSSTVVAAVISGVLRTAPAGHEIGFATGGTVPGRFVGRQDTVMARLTPGEVVLPRALVAAIENGSLGGGSGPTVAIFKIDGREFARATAQPMTAEQARQIGYTIQRG
jgi:hypothetical protein